MSLREVSLNADDSWPKDHVYGGHSEETVRKVILLIFSFVAFYGYLYMLECKMIVYDKNSSVILQYAT